MLFLLALATISGSPQDPTPQHRLVGVPFEKVELTSSFWALRQEVNRRVTVPAVLDQCERTGRIQNFERAADGAREGAHQGNRYDDSDVYKALEAVAHTLALRPDPGLEERADGIIARIAAAQREDGYLNTYVTLERPGSRWQDARDGHELYCAGHLIEAGIAYFQGTGKRELLDVAIRFADLICEEFGPSGRRSPPGHQEIELALARLHRLTGEERYLDQAEFFLDQRGAHPGLWGSYYQDVLPVRKQFAVSGHAVRSMYQFCGMADVYAATGEYELLAALLNCWRDVKDTRMYVTGGIGSSAKNEGFTEPHDKPNASAWCETCAAAGMVMWNARMLPLTRQAAFADVLERALYNGFLVGVSLEGDRFSYENPLATPGGLERQPWFATACCPTNVARLIPTIGGTLYAHDQDEIYVAQYAASVAELELGRGKVVIEQVTDYPWNGKVVLEITPERPMDITFHLRAPQWCVDPITLGVGDALSEVKVNRGDMPGVWLTLQRRWLRGDRLTIDMPMPVRRVHDDERVEANRGRVALQRGPLVYALEGFDNDGFARNKILPPKGGLQADWEDGFLGGAVVVRGDGQALLEVDGKPKVVKADLVAVPYPMWGNRGAGEMVVWIPETAELAEFPGEGARVTRRGTTARASHCYARDTLAALDDGVLPARSSDDTVPRMTFRDHLGSKEWLLYEFDEERLLEGVRVYWYDDSARGGVCAPPRSWKIYWKHGEDWLPAKLVRGSFYWTTSDALNEVSFEPVRTRALRLELELRPDRSAGVLEWQAVDVP